MKNYLLFICLGLLSLNAYPQSKLQGGGKASKVGVTTPKTTSPAKPSTSSSQPKRNSGVRNSHASSGYMEIQELSFANADYNMKVIDNFDSKLYAKDIKYLRPRISYKGLASEEKEITLDVKLFDEDGNLKTGTGSPDGYTYNDDVKVEPGTGNYLYLSGWGTQKGGSYSAGLYKMEVWYQGSKLYQKELRLYSGSRPVISNNMFSISSVSFASTDEDGNILIDYGMPLYDGKVQYLKAKINYNGKYSSNQEATIHVRYFKSSGDLVCGASSPVGFSFKDNVTIKPGSNNVTLSGFGNASASNYKEGTCKVEFWMDGEKFYETNVTINKEGSYTYSGGEGGTSSLSTLFPIFGVTIGKTTWKQMEALGGKVETNSGGKHYSHFNNIYFWDHDNVGRFMYIYWTHYGNDFPTSWKEKGFSWDNSYNTWLNVLRKLGFNVTVTNGPVTKEYSGRQTLSADVRAISSDGLLRFEFDFDYGEDGHLTSSPKSLYSLTIRYLGN